MRRYLRYIVKVVTIYNLFWSTLLSSCCSFAYCAALHGKYTCMHIYAHAQACTRTRNIQTLIHPPPFPLLTHKKCCMAQTKDTDYAPNVNISLTIIVTSLKPFLTTKLPPRSCCLSSCRLLLSQLAHCYPLSLHTASLSACTLLLSHLAHCCSLSLQQKFPPGPAALSACTLLNLRQT